MFLNVTFQLRHRWWPHVCPLDHWLFRHSFWAIPFSYPLLWGVGGNCNVIVEIISTLFYVLNLLLFVCSIFVYQQSTNCLYIFIILLGFNNICWFFRICFDDSWRTCWRFAIRNHWLELHQFAVCLHWCHKVCSRTGTPFINLSVVVCWVRLKEMLTTKQSCDLHWVPDEICIFKSSFKSTFLHLPFLATPSILLVKRKTLFHHNPFSMMDH